MTARRVVVRDVRTRDLVAMIEQLDDVIRELALIQIGSDTGTAEATVPKRVLETMDRVRPLLFEQKESISKQASAAWMSGVGVLDVVVELPETAVATIVELLEVLEAVDAQSVGDGSMLVPAASPAVATFRRWFFTYLVEALGDAAAGAARGVRADSME